MRWVPIGLIGYRLNSSNTAHTIRFRRALRGQGKPRLSAMTGADFPKWRGQCGECHAWNTLSEIRLSTPASKATARSGGRAGYAGTVASVQRLEDVAVVDLPRLGSGFDEFDRVLGGGFVPGSSILIGGHPGAGKSTLLLQTLCRLAEAQPALYVTGEESPEQIAMRANRRIAH